MPLWQKAWAWIEANKKPTIWGAASLAAIALIVSFFLYHQKEAEIAASEALSNLAAPQMGGAGRGDSAEAYLKLAATYPNSRAAGRALLLAAGRLFEEGKYAEAHTQFERLTREYTDSPFRGQALLGMAACLDAQGKSNEAATAYKNLIDRYPTDPVLPQARFALARLYEAQNKPELARNLLEEVERNNPYGSLGSEAGMRLEELKTKYPQLAAPTTPSATIAPTTPAPTNALPLQPQKRS